MAEGLIIDPTSEDATNVQLDLVDGVNTFLLEAAYPPPDRDQMWAPSADTEGDPLVQTRFKNRQITVKIRVAGSSASALQTVLGYIEQKAGKVSREGGTLKRTVPSGSTVVFDLLGMSADIAVDSRFVKINRAEVTIVFDAKPFGRGASVTGSSHAESTLPVLVFTETGIGGDVPALGQLVVTEAQGADQYWFTWGQQSRYYDSAATAKLFYEAEACTALGTAAAAVGQSGASGSTTNKVILSGALTTTYQAVMSTQASGGGAHLTHVGDFQVYARVQTPSANAGAVSVALEWALGDYRNPTRNTPTTFPIDSWDGTWRLVNLGQVSLTKATTGSQRWEGRVLAASTTIGDVLDIDYLMLVPVVEGAGTAQGLAPTASPASFSARDEFGQAAGGLSGKTAPAGGSWATTTDSGGGAATDFQVTGSSVTRAATDGLAGTNLGRLATLSTGGLAAVVAQCDLSWNPTANDSLEALGVLARYVDASNHLYAHISLIASNSTATFHVSKNVAGGFSTILSSPIVQAAAGDIWTVRVAIDASGRVYLWYWKSATGLPGTPLTTLDGDCATGGTLATGKVGLWSRSKNSTVTHIFGNFAAWVPVSDAAIFASETAAVRNDGVIRQDSTGSFWQPVSSYEGDYLLVPPAGREARTTRFIVKATRNDPAAMADTNIDDISAQLTVTPRFLVVPE